jgi:PAS domain S-box-containing protein
MNDKLLQGKKSLAAAPTRFEAILASLAATGDAVLIADEQERVLYVNPAAEKMFGCTAAGTLGQTLDQLIPDTVSSAPRKRAARPLRVTERLRAKPGQLVGQRAAGEQFPLEASLSQTEAEGQTLFALTLRDLSERQQADTSLRESRERLQLALEAGGMFAWELDLGTGRVALSENAGKLLGLESEAFGGSFEDLLAIVHPADRAALKQSLESAQQQDRPFEQEIRTRSADGGLCWNLVRGRVYRDPQDQPVRLAGVGVDITARKQAEGDVLFLTQLSERIRRDGRAETVTHEITRALGEHLQVQRCFFTENDLTHDRFIVHQDYCDSVPAMAGVYTFSAFNSFWGEIASAGQTLVLRDAASDPRTAGYESYRQFGIEAFIYVPLLREERLVAGLSATTTAPRDWQAREIALLETVAEFTWQWLERLRSEAERKQAQAALLTNEARMAGIIDSAMDAIISVDERHRIVLFNTAAEKMFAYSTEEMIGEPLSRLIPESFRAAHDEHIRRFGETGVTARVMGVLTAVSGLRRDGDVFPIEASISQIEAGGEKLFTVIMRDITARRLAAEQLNEQAALLNHAREAIAAVDTTGHILFWNRGAERLYGWKTEDVMGRNIDAQVFHENLAQRDEARRVLFEKGEWTGELHQFTKDGREITVESHCTLVRDPDGRHKSTLIINTDITEKKKLEQQFLRAQRMESLGTLAGGIAHDLNNVLSPITMGVQMLQMKHSDEFSRKMLGVMAANAERGAAMIKQILSFVRGAGGERIPLQPQHLVKEVVKMMRETFPKEIEIKQQLGENLCPVEGDPTELHQVLMNLCVNARDAMPRGGVLSIRIENQAIDELSARMWPQARAGNYVAITVADTGDGISAEHLDRIFEPFFTTKEQGKGTGLGLATVHGIVKAHGGFIDVYSEVGRGTQFNIYLPAQAGLRPAEAEAAPRDTPVGDGELILVVDDEASIREMTRSALEAFGYRVLAAGDGAEAVNLYAQHSDEVQLVLTDMMMPVMDGLAMIRALQRINPRVAVIGSSGLAESGKADEARQLGVERILSKPYNAETLLKTVAQAIRKNE